MFEIRIFIFLWINFYLTTKKDGREIHHSRPEKIGDYLLSHIASQYHRRKRA